MTVEIWIHTRLVRLFSRQVRVLTQFTKQRVSCRECPEPVGGHPTGLIGIIDQFGPTAQRLVFQKHYKKASTPSLVGCWFLTIYIVFQQPIELSPTSLCEIQSLVQNPWVGLRDLSCVSKWASILSLEHFGLHQALMKHLLLLEVKLPRQLGIVLDLPSLWWVLGNFVKVCFTFKRKEAGYWIGESGWKRPDLELTLVSNSSFLNGDIGITGLVISNFSK
jgi:hypothetical protein